MKEPIKLISFKICPFVQRSVIALKEKRANYQIEYIDLAHKPDWFLKISPLGKVPVLMVQNEILFESAIINEYLDETISPALHPAQPLLRAKNRSWIEYTSQCLNTLYNWTLAPSDEEAKKQALSLTENINRFAAEIKEPWFNGQSFSLVECAVAPLFFRLKFIERRYGVQLNLTAKANEYAERILGRPSVKESAVEDFDALSDDWFRTKNSWLTRQRS